MSSMELGEAIPKDTAHAVSVSLPTWKSNIGYEEGESWVIERMTSGYPRFFVHPAIAKLAGEIVQKYGRPGQVALPFPSAKAASRCIDFILRKTPAPGSDISQLSLILDSAYQGPELLRSLSPFISVVLCKPDLYPVAREYWQHTGDGCSSRRAEFCLFLLGQELLTPEAPEPQSAAKKFFAKDAKGPRRYQRPSSVDSGASPAPSPIPKLPSLGYGTEDVVGGGPSDTIQYVEERYGRNLDLSLSKRAESAIRRRIAGAISADIDVSGDNPPEMYPNIREMPNLREDDVYLFPCGMNSIFNTHRALLRARGELKSVSFGFPYVDTLKILQKFGPGCDFFGQASTADLDELETRLKRGDRFLALFCEFPGNPLLASPDLVRIRSLADEYDFAVVVDETIGTFANVNVIRLSDVVVSSLTKIFSGDCNVMGGAAIINPDSRYYSRLKPALDATFEDTYWPEDVIFMERNSRDYRSRIGRINANSEAICQLLMSSRVVKNLYYPKFNPSRSHYDACRLPNGGYGGLLSVTFHQKDQAIAFYDALDTAKGPSLGTNFTLTSPYVLLAHYKELDWARSLGVDPDLVRVSAGLEETEELVAKFRIALDAAESLVP